MKCRMTLNELSIGNKGMYGIAASAVPKSDDLYTYLRITDINDDGTLNFADLKSVDDINADKYILKPNDIVFARTGGSTGRNYFYDGRDGTFVFAGFLIKFSINESLVNPKYIKYFCRSQEYKGWVSSFNTGSTRGNINAQTYGNLEIPLIPREKQDQLVKILSSIDDKIELNNKINDNLEKQAQAIYSDMFANNDKNNILSDIANITMGQSPAGSSYNETGDGTVFYQGRAEFNSRFPKRRLFTTEPKRMAEENDILLSVRAPVGDINIAHERCCIGRGLSAIHSKTSHSSFLLYTMLSSKKELDVYNGEGTVFGSINREALNNLPIFLPNADLIQKFEDIVSAMDNIIRVNSDETERLTQLRDTLLPKLMSGEIDVSEVEV